MNHVVLHLFHYFLIQTTFTLSVTSFTIKDKSAIPTIAPSTTSPAPSLSSSSTYAPASEAEQSSLIPPKKLALFIRTLQDLVQSQCSNVDDLGLDTFQTYLIRQILNGNVQTLKVPLGFNSLTENITGCVNRYSLYASDHVDLADLDNERKITILPPTLLPHDFKTSTEATKPFQISPHVKPIETSTPTPFQEPPTSKPILESNSPTPKPLKKPLLLFHVHNLPSTPSPPVKSDSKKENENQVQPSTTIFDKIIFNMTNFAENVVSKTKQAISSIFFKFDRKKREAKEIPQQTDYYYKSAIPSPNKAIDDPEDNYEVIWKAVTASETKMTAYFHVIHMLRNFISLAVEMCPPAFQVDESLLFKICNLIATLVMEDLVKAESNGMSLRINEKLENDLDECVVKRITFKLESEFS